MTTIAFARPPSRCLHAAPEVLDHHLRLLLDVVRVQAHELGQRSRGLLLRQLGIVFGRLEQTVIGGVGRVVRQHVEDEAFLDRLPHAVDVEGFRNTVRARRPNSSRVLPLGVAVKAKKLRFGCRPRDCITSFKRSSQSVSPLFTFCRSLPKNRLQLTRCLASLAGVQASGFSPAPGADRGGHDRRRHRAQCHSRGRRPLRSP